MNIRTLAATAAVAVTLGSRALLGLTALPEPAQAQVAAKVEAQTRPNFGVLLDPPTRGRARSHRRWD